MSFRPKEKIKNEIAELIYQKGKFDYNRNILEEIHRDYIIAGADIITANTYSTSRLMLSLSGHEKNFLEINKKTIEAAQRARRTCSKKDILIAGSLSHRGPIAEGTAIPNRQDKASIHQLENALTELGNILREEGCDFILLDMMYDPERMRAAFNAAEKTGLPIWAGFSARQSKNGDLFSFLPEPDIPLIELLTILSDFNPDASGFMHTQSDAIESSLKVLKKKFTGPLFAYPDSGYFKSPNWQFENIISSSNQTVSFLGMTQSTLCNMSQIRDLCHFEMHRNSN